MFNRLFNYCFSAFGVRGGYECSVAMAFRMCFLSVRIQGVSIFVVRVLDVRLFVMKFFVVFVLSNRWSSDKHEPCEGKKDSKLRSHTILHFPLRN
jgi:hypothetical protein